MLKHYAIFFSWNFCKSLFQQCCTCSPFSCPDSVGIQPYPDAKAVRHYTVIALTLIPTYRVEKSRILTTELRPVTTTVGKTRILSNERMSQVKCMVPSWDGLDWIAKTIMDFSDSKRPRCTKEHTQGSSGRNPTQAHHIKQGPAWCDN